MKTMASECAPAAPGQGLDPQLRWHIEAACIRLLTQYCVSADRHDLNMFLEVFSADAEWQRPAGGKLTGRAEISAFFQQRSKDELTCHISSNALIVVEGLNSAKGTSLATVYRHTPNGIQLSCLSPKSIVEYRDEFARDEAGEWRIRRRSSHSILRAFAKTIDEAAR